MSEREKAWLEGEGADLKVLFGYEAPPNAYHDEEGRYQGFLVDFHREIERTLGIDIPMEMFETWSELMDYAKEENNYIVVGIADSEARREFMNFTEPFIKIPYVLVCRQSQRIESLEDAGTSLVGAVEGYSVMEYLAFYYPRIETKGYRDNLEGLRAVSTGDCDVMVLNQMYATYLINREGLSNLVIAGNSGYVNRLSVGMSKKDADLLNIIDKTLDRIKAHSKEAIYHQWVGTGSVWLSRRSLYSLFTAGGIVLFIVLVLWGWLFFLRREVKRQTDLIRQKEGELKRAERIEALGVLAGGIAHDFNNLLTGIYGYLDLAMKEADEGTTLYSYLREADGSMNRASLLAKQLLTLTSKKKPAVKELDLAELVRTATDLYLSRPDLSLNMVISPRLWRVLGDWGQLDQVVTNLIVNGMQAMDEKGELTLTLKNEKRAGERFVRLDVEDRGRGIPRENLDRIFDPYFTTKEMGNGLGLASSFAIVQNHGGQITVESHPGAGSVFTVLLPAADGGKP